MVDPLFKLFLVEKKNVQEFNFFPNLPVEITGLYPRHVQVLFRPFLFPFFRFFFI